MAIPFTFGQTFSRSVDSAIGRRDQRDARQAFESFRLKQLQESVRANDLADEDRDLSREAAQTRFESGLVPGEDGTMRTPSAIQAELAQQQAGQNVSLSVPGFGNIDGVSPNQAVNFLIANRRANGPAETTATERFSSQFLKQFEGAPIQELVSARDALQQSLAGEVDKGLGTTKPPSPDDVVAFRPLLLQLNQMIAQKRSAEQSQRPPNGVDFILNQTRQQ